MNLHRFRLGDLYEAAHILIAAAPGDAPARKAARTTAETILTAVEADGRAFADLAANHSDCTTSAPDGGRLGQISRGQTVPEFEAALERMKPGEVVIVETRYGLHVVRLDHRVEGKTLPFEMARERIADYLASSVEHRALAQYVSILAGRAEITGVSLSGATTPLVQ
jgi:peptidyl-prolyl cis-trans isomerase C